MVSNEHDIIKFFLYLSNDNNYISCHTMITFSCMTWVDSYTDTEKWKSLVSDENDF